MHGLTISACGAVILGLVTATTETGANKPKEYLFFDFTSARCSETVKKIFQNVTVVQKFKMYGDSRFILVVENDQSQALKQLDLPSDAGNVRVMPLEHLYDYFLHFGVSWQGSPEKTPDRVFPDDNLNFAEATWHFDGTLEEMKATMTALANQIQAGNSKTLVFTRSGAVPLKFFLLMNRSDYYNSDVYLKLSSTFGGPGGMSFSSFKIFNI